MAWTRLTLGLSTACFIAAVSPALVSPAHAQSPAKQADGLNEQGKALLNAKPMRAAEATAKFRAAIVLSPEGRFYLNLCMALYQEGKLSEALTACQAVAPKGATPAQVTQAGVIVEKFIEPKMREVGVDPDKQPDPNNGNTDPNNGNTDPNNGNTDPNNGNTDPNHGNTDPNHGNTDPNHGNTSTPGAVTVAPPPSLFAQTTTKPLHEYTWTIGAQVLGLAATVGEKGDWQKGAGGLRILGDYVISKNKLIGAQGYLGFFNVSGTNDGAFMDESLSIVDLGIAIYKEQCRGRLCFKPLAGVQIALLQPSDLDGESGFSALGARGELGLEYALGARYENVLTLGVGVNIYFPASESSGSLALPEDYGLDKSSATGYLAIGYTRRFATPLGSQPLFTLQ